MESSLQRLPSLFISLHFFTRRARSCEHGSTCCWPRRHLYSTPNKHRGCWCVSLYDICLLRHHCVKTGRPHQLSVPPSLWECTIVSLRCHGQHGKADAQDNEVTGSLGAPTLRKGTDSA